MAKKKTKKRGRPRARHPMDEQLAVKCRSHQKDRYLAASDAAQMELSEWIRHVLDREASHVLADCDPDGGTE